LLHLKEKFGGNYITLEDQKVLVFTEKEFGLKEIGKTKIAFIHHFFI